MVSASHKKNLDPPFERKLTDGPSSSLIQVFQPTQAPTPAQFFVAERKATEEGCKERERRNAKLG